MLPDSAPLTPPADPPVTAAYRWKLGRRSQWIGVAVALLTLLLAAWATEIAGFVLWMGGMLGGLFIGIGAEMRQSVKDSRHV